MTRAGERLIAAAEKERDRLATGFHPHDAEWTRGRATAISQADGIARMQAGLSRSVALKEAALTEIARLGQEWDAAK